MPIVTYVSPTGAARDIAVPAGMFIMQAAINNGVDGILGECGGNCMCATCHVYVHVDFLNRIPPASKNENAMLEITAAERKPNSRLSCQIKVQDELDGLVVQLPAKQR
jgi:ferredoxin, 2Fe-2S